MKHFFMALATLMFIGASSLLIVVTNKQEQRSIVLNTNIEDYSLQKQREEMRQERYKALEKERLAKAEKERIARYEADKKAEEEAARLKAEQERQAELERQRQLEIARAEKEKREKQIVISRGENSQQIQQQAQDYKAQQQQQIQAQQTQGNPAGVFNVTGYGIDCVGCTGITASGVPMAAGQTHYQGYRVVAADWSVLPPYSIINVQGIGQCIVLDRGGAIQGNKLDVLFPSEAATYSFGRQNLQVSVIRYGN